MKLALGLTTLAVASAQTNSSCIGEDASSVYSPDLVAMRAGKNVSMDTFAGKVGLAINVASF
jgi:hypothetical protein